MSRDAVRATMREPPRFTSDGHDAWDFDNYRFIVNYKKDGRIEDCALTGDF
jgi:hypothetical protein